MLRQYVVARIKLIEFLDVASMRQLLRSGQVEIPVPFPRPAEHFAETLRTVQRSYLPVLVEKGGLDILSLWSKRVIAGSCEPTNELY